MRINDLVFLLFGLLTTSCLSDDGFRNEERYSIRVEVEPPCLIGDVKSSFDETMADRINDLNIFVYHQGSLLDEYGGYFDDVSSLMMAFPYGKDGFNIYMVGNVGEIKAPESEEDIGGICCVAGSYDELRTKGFPLANVFYDYTKGSRTVFGLKRLVGRYDLTLCSSATDASYNVKDVRLMNCALDVYPFSNDTKAAVFASSNPYDQDASADVLTQDDLDRLNAGGTVSLYFIENLQGCLLPDNKDRRKKIPSSLQESVADRCTYLEITADVETQAATYKDGRFRFYLGQDETSDFSIVRNTLYEVGVDFTQNMVSEEEWRIEVEAPEVKSIVVSKETAHVTMGIDDYILIQGPRVEIGNTNDEDYGDEWLCSLSDVTIDGVKYQKLSFTSYKEIDYKRSWSSNYTDTLSNTNYLVTLNSTEKYNGKPLTSKKVRVYVHSNIIPIFIRMGTNSQNAPYQLEVITNAPINLDFDLSAVLTADVGGTGTVNTYYTSTTGKCTTSEGYQCTYARFETLYNKSLAQPVYFRTLDVTLKGKKTDLCDLTSIFMGDEGKLYIGPNNHPGDASGNITGTAALSRTYVNTDGSYTYRIQESGQAGYLLYYSPNESTGFRGCNFDEDEFQDMGYSYLPVYIINGVHDTMGGPTEEYNSGPYYLDDSGRVGWMWKTYIPGRDVFYPNGAVWGSSSELKPSNEGRFGYIGAHMTQFWGNVHSWTVYSGYECDFFMTVNGNTAWRGGTNLSTGFLL